jgi:hypothetical protein
MHDKNVTSADLNRRLGHKLRVVAAAALVLMASGVNAETQSSAKSDKLLVAPIPSDSGPNTAKQPKAGNSRSLTRDRGVPADIWTSQPVGPHSDSYWNPFGIDVGAGADGDGRSKKFGYAPPVPGSANSFDKLKIGDGYLGVDTQRRLQTRVPSGKVDCATDEECQDYSALPGSRSRGSVGTSSSSPVHGRKPFFGLSITTPIE